MITQRSWDSTLSKVTIERVQSIDIRCTDSDSKKIILRYPVVAKYNPSISINFEPSFYGYGDITSFYGYGDITLSFRSTPMQIIETPEED